MPPEKNISKKSPAAAELRQQAEKKLGKQKSAKTPLTETDTSRLLHELQVHQIELEMQNEELVQARADSEAVHRQYTDLYDFAPVGYFTLARDGAISQVNLTGANLLGAERGKLLKRRFGLFVAPKSRPIFAAFLEKVFLAEDKKQTCEVELLRGKTESFWAQIEAAYVDSDEACRAVVVDISARVQADESLRASEMKFRQTFDISPVGIVMVGLDKRFIRCNLAFAQSLGYGTEELVGKLIEDITLPEDSPIGMAEIMAIMKGEIAQSQVHKRYLRKDGQVIWGEVTISLIRDSDGRAQYFLAIIQDVTERKQAEEALTQQNDALLKLNRFSIELTMLSSEDNLEALIARQIKEIAGAEVAIFSEYDPANRTTTAQHIEMKPGLLDKVVHLLGTQVKNIHSVVSDEMYREMTTDIIGARRTLYEASFGAIPRPIGAAIQALLKVDRFIGIAYLIEGKLYGTSLLGMSKDQPDPPREILENFIYLAALSLRRNLAEEALRESDCRLNEAQRIGKIGSWEWSPAVNKVIWSTEMYAIFGIPPENANLTTEMVLQAFHPEDRPMVAEATRKALEENKPQPIECRILKPDGTTVYVYSHAEAVLDANDKLVKMTGIYQDITERKQAEDQLKEEKEHFEMLFNTNPDSVQITRLTDGLVQNVNDGFTLISGFAREDIIGKRTLDIDLWENPEDRQNVIDELTKNGYCRNYEAIFKRKDGSRFCGMMSSKLYSYQGKPHAITVTRDITERKQAENIIKNRNQILLALHNVTMEMGAELHLPVLLDSILEHAQSMLDADRGGGIYLYDAGENVMRLERGSGINQGRDGITVRIDQGVVGRVFQTSQPFVIDDYTHWEGRATVLVADPPSTVMGVPLFLKNQSIGVLTLIANSHLRKFSELDIEQAKMFAAQTAIAIQNAQHYQQAQEDIIERKRAEELLRETSERLAHMLANSPTVIYALKVEGAQAMPMWISENIESILGFSAEDGLQPEWWLQQIHPEDLQAALASLEHLSDDFYQHEYRFSRKDGRLIWLHDEHRLLRNEDNKPWEVVGAWTDITERKQAEESLRLLSARQEAILTAIPDILMEVNNDKTYTWANPAGLAFFGEGVIGKEAAFYFEGEQDTYAQVKPLFNGGEDVIYVESWQRRKDGEKRLLAWQCRVLKDIDGNVIGALSSAHDITERLQAEQKLAQYSEHLEEMVTERTRELTDVQEKLVRHEKLAVLGQLAGGVGHELRNPLAVINNAVYYLKLVQPEADEKVKEYLTMIERETHTAEKIITDLLDFARIKFADHEPVSVSELTQRVLARYPAPDSVAVSLDFPIDLPQVYVDPRQMEQVLGNLMINACQAMSAGGKLTISAQWQKQMVAIAVKDTGVGIPPENMKKLFEPLFTTKAKGIGLGLAVSQKLAEANGGRIEVQSEPGQGSTFTLCLPAYLPPQNQAEP